MGSIRYALLNIKLNIKNAKELKSSFLMTVFGMALNNISFLILWYYFGKTVGELNGWTAVDMFGLYGFTVTSYGMVSSVLAGITDIPKFISLGTMDRFLTTPKNILLKIATSKINTSAFGDLLFGVTCFIIYWVSVKLTLVQLLLSLLLMIICAIITITFTLFSMSVSFYLMEGENVSMGIFGMFLGNSTYHGGAFVGFLRAFFMFVVPSLLVGAIPVEIVKSFDIAKLVLLIILTIFWSVFSVWFFYKSLKRYESTNFFGFGS